MKNKKLVITIVVCVLLIAGTVGFLYWYDQKDKDTDDKKDTSSGSSSSSSTSTSTSSSGSSTADPFPLKKGSKNSYVKALQTQLNLYISYKYFGLPTKPPYQSLTVDGNFGPKTEANVQWYFNKKTVDRLDFWKFINLIVTPAGVNTVQNYDFFKYLKY